MQVIKDFLKQGNKGFSLLEVGMILGMLTSLIIYLNIGPTTSLFNSITNSDSTMDGIQNIQMSLQPMFNDASSVASADPHRCVLTINEKTVDIYAQAASDKEADIFVKYEDGHPSLLQSNIAFRHDTAGVGLSFDYFDMYGEHTIIEEEVARVDVTVAFYDTQSQLRIFTNTFPINTMSETVYRK